jgi:hypothetical protein
VNAEIAKRSSRREDIRWAASVIAGTALPFLVVLVTGRTVVWRDSAKLFEPLRPLVAEALRDGRLPLWNPHEALGLPLLAQQIHAVLHPVSVLGALFAPDAGVEVLAFSYVVLAALGAGILARTLGASLPGAAVAGFGYGLSGYLLGMTAIVQLLGAAATAPWAVAALRAVGEGRRFGAASAAVAVACLAFAGDPQWSIAAVVIGSALAWDAGGTRGLVRAFASAALGAMLGAIQLLPAWSYFGETLRGSGIAESDRLVWAFAPWRTIELIAPGFFGGVPGGPAAPVYYALGGGGPYGIPFVTSAFVGIIPIVFAVTGARASRAGAVLGGAALVCLWIAFGHWLGAEPVLHQVPIWNAFRYSEKLLGPFTLCVAVLGGLGAERTTSSFRRHGGIAALAASCLFLAALLLIAVPATAGMFGRVGAPDFAALARHRLGVGLVHAAAALAALAGLCSVSRRFGADAHFAALAPALVLAQSLAASPFALHAGPRGARDSRALEPLKSGAEPARIAVPIGSIDSTNPEDPEEFERLSAVESRMGVPSYNVASRVDGIDPLLGLVPHAFARVRLGLERAFGPEQMWLAWRRFALTHVVTGPAGDRESRAISAAAVRGGVPVLADSRFGITLFEVPHRPWAFFAGSTIPANSGEDAVQKLVEALESGSDAVVLEGERPRTLATGRVLGTSRGASVVKIEAESAGEALLVVNDAFWPGWQATIDGHPTPILRADALVRAIPWPAGRHVLEMRYAPREVTFGLALTAAGCLALVLLVIRDLRRSVSR